jgi:glycosyl transferase family 25
MWPDITIYINLDKRTDRRAEIEAEFNRVKFPASRTMRWPAVLREGKGPTGGSLGCTLSHIGVLQYVMTLPEDVKTILVLEDDFNFAEAAQEALEKFLRYPRSGWDICLLSYHVIEHEKYDELVSISLRSHGTAGYLINREAVPALLKIFEESRDGILQTGGEQFVIDVYWHNFMKNRRCFYFNKPLGYQRKSYSDIQQLEMLNPSYAD